MFAKCYMPVPPYLGRPYGTALHYFRCTRLCSEQNSCLPSEISFYHQSSRSLFACVPALISTARIFYLAIAFFSHNWGPSKQKVVLFPLQACRSKEVMPPHFNLAVSVWKTETVPCLSFSGGLVGLDPAAHRWRTPQCHLHHVQGDPHSTTRIIYSKLLVLHLAMLMVTAFLLPFSVLPLWVPTLSQKKK